MGAKHYTAFISYSHNDEAFAKRLHRRLEGYKPPKHLIQSQGKYGPVPPNLKPIFRDQDELSVDGNLSRAIQTALEKSSALIVLCSPAAVASRWVNEEIITFKRLAKARGEEARIYPVLVSGEPYAAKSSRPEEQECLPEAVRFALGENGDLSEIPVEPLAADMRETGAPLRLALSKLQAALLGLELDEIVQRDLQRQRRRMTAITASSLIAMLSMATLTGLTLEARRDADERRGDAEGLIEFMLTDLKDKLEPVGRLDALETVGDKASEYYERQALSNHDDDALGRRARVHHFLGEVSHTQGQTAEAIEFFDKAYLATESLLARSPQDPERIFNHAQSAFWRATPIYFAGKYDDAKPLIQDYINLAERLNKLEPETIRGLQEPGFAYQNMAVLNHRQGDYLTAEQFFQKAYRVKSQLAALYPTSVEYGMERAESLGWLASNNLAVENYAKSRDFREQEALVYKDLIALEPNNKKLQFQLANVNGHRADLENTANDYDAALTYNKIAVSIFEKLRNHDPENVNWAHGYFHQRQQELRLLLKLNKIKLAEEKLSTLQPELSAWENKLGQDNIYVAYQKTRSIYTEVLTKLLTEGQKEAQDATATYITKFEPNIGKGDFNMSLFIDLISINSAASKNSAKLDAFMKKISQMGTDDTPLSDIQKLRLEAAREFSNGNPAALNRYLSREDSWILKRIFGVIRDSE